MSSSENSALVLFLAVLILLALARLASAGVEFLSTPSSLQTSDGETDVFEDTRFEFSSNEDPVSFHFSGESLQPWDENDFSSSDAVLDYAYVKLRSRRLKTDFSLGRLQPDENMNAELVDGIYSRSSILPGSQLSFFMGRTVDTGDDLMGGRFGYRFSEAGSGGISYLTESSGPQTIREDLAFDARLRPFNKLFLSGRSLLDLGTGAWTEHAYSAKLGPFRNTTLLFDASLARYEDSGSSADIPAFGTGIQYRLSRRMAAAFDVRRTEDPFEGPVWAGGVHLSYSSPRTWNGGFSIIRRRGDSLDALEISAHAAKKYGHLDSSLDLQKIIYDGDLSSDKNSSSARLGLGWEFGSGYRLAAEMQEIKNPDSRPDLRSFLKLEYRFGS